MSTAEYPWPQNEADPPPAAAAAPALAAVRPLSQKNPMLAAILSAFPGIGHVYNGLYMRGLTFFLITVSLMTLLSQRGNVLVAMSMTFFWIFNIIDAYRQATLINYGYAQDLGLLDMPKRPMASQGGLVAGVILTLIGIFAFLETYFDIDLEWMVDFWPLFLVGIGLWLIVGSIRDRSKRRAAGLPS